MKKQFLFLILIISFSNAFGQNFQWVKNLGGTDVDYGGPIAVDKLRNLYSAGTFSGTADFDPGLGTYTLATPNPTTINSDIYISKLDAAGSFIWAKRVGGVGADNIGSIFLDKYANIYVTGGFNSTTDFDPGPNVYNLSVSGGYDAFVMKLDSSGNFIWAKKFGGSADDMGYGVVVDSLGKIFLTGSFRSTADFDPGISTYNLTSAGSDEIFVSKLDSLGNFLWAKKFGDISDDKGFGIVLDNSNYVLLTGYFYGTIDFDPGPSVVNLTSTGTDAIFILKLDSSGNFSWAKKMGAGSYTTGNCLVVDKANNVYSTGGFSNPSDFNPGPDIYTLAVSGNTDMYISKLDSLGNFIWAKKVGGVGPDVGTSLVLDESANLYVTGAFGETVDFDPGLSTSNLVAIGAIDIFTAKFDSSGNYKWAKGMGSATWDRGNSIAIDSFTNVYVSGYFGGTIDFDPSPTTFNLTANGSWDAFILKFAQSVVPITLLNFEVTKNKNDVQLDWQTATESNTDKFELEKSDDGISFKKFGEIKASGNSNSIKKYHFVDFNASGNNRNQAVYYRFKQMDLDGKFDYSPIRSIKFDEKVLGLQVYPNPAKDAITISFSAVEDRLPYFITNQDGKRILSGYFTNRNSQTLSIRNLATGAYFIYVGQTNMETVKFFKQ